MKVPTGKSPQDPDCGWFSNPDQFGRHEVRKQSYILFVRAARTASCARFRFLDYLYVLIAGIGIGMRA